jgi:multiple sugar transport system permease protein
MLKTKKLKRVNRRIGILLLLLAVIIIFPFILMLGGSLKTGAEINGSTFSILPSKPQFSNYITAFSRGSWGRWFFNSLLVTALTTAVSLIINSMAGYAFARLKFRGKNILFYSVLLGLMVPPQLTILPTFIIMKKFPLIGGNSLLGVGGTGFINTFGGLMLPIFAGAFGIFLCRQYFLNFPRALDEAAKIDGCTPINTFWKIYIPNSKSLMMSLGVLKATYSWNDYIWPLAIVQSEEMMTVQLGLSRFKDVTIHWESLMAATTVVMVPMIIMFLVSQRYLVLGLVTSGMKE